MGRALTNLIRKEVLDLLRDPKILLGMIILPAVIYPVIGVATRVSMTAAGETALRTPVAVLDMDNSRESAIVVASLQATGKVILLSSSVDDALSEARSAGAGALIVIPEGFGETLRSGARLPIEVVVFFERGGFSAAMFSGRLQGALESASRALSALLVSEGTDLSPEVVLNPLTADYKSIFRGEELDLPPEVVAQAIVGQISTMPLVASMVLIFAMQIAATSVAVEKEEKTLETLLTLPVSRRSILLAKLSGSAVVAALGSLGVLAGLMYYMKIVAAMPGEQQIPQISLLGTKDVALLAVALIIANMLALTLATVLSVFTEDVRSAQALVGNLFILVFLPAFLLMFADVSSLPRAAALALQAIPFSHIALAAQSIAWRDYGSYLISVVYMLVWSAGVAFLADRIFSSEKVLTARFRWGRRRARE